MKKFLLGICAGLLVLCACGNDKTKDGSFSPGNDDTKMQTGTKQTQTEIQSGIQSQTKAEAQPETSTQAVTTPQDSQEQDAVLRILNSMTLEEKVGQMFFVRCPENGAVEDVSKYHFGGYLLFGRDFAGKTQEEVKAMTAAYQEASGIPLFIGVDEEGGSVVRVSSNDALWNHKFLSPQEIFQSQGMGEGIYAYFIRYQCKFCACLRCFHRCRGFYLPAQSWAGCQRDGGVCRYGSRGNAELPDCFRTQTFSRVWR